MDPTTAKMIQMHLQAVRELCEGVDELVLAELRSTRQSKGEKEETEVKVGDKVRITAAGKHRGREGVITKQRSETFWYIALAATKEAVGEEIYRKHTSFTVIKEERK